MSSMSADRSACSVKAIYLGPNLVTLWISWSLAMELRFDGDRGHLVQMRTLWRAQASWRSLFSILLTGSTTSSIAH